MTCGTAQWWSDVLLVLPAVWTALKLVWARGCAWRADVKAGNLTQEQRDILNANGGLNEWEVEDNAVEHVLKLRRMARRIESYSGLLPNWVVLCLAAGLCLKLGLLIFC